MRALALHSDWLRRLAIAHPGAVPQRLLRWFGMAAAVARSDAARARGSAVWLGWDAWVSPVGHDRSRSPSAEPPSSTPRRQEP